MSGDRLLNLSERWFRLLLRLYPVDFRDDMGDAVVETYRDRARDALARRGVLGIAGVWFHALTDTLRNGPGERARPAVSWRRSGRWARDAEFATRRLIRAPAMVAAVVGTLTVGLGMFSVVYTVVQKILIAPMPYTDPDDLYFVWRDYRAYFDLDRGWLGGTLPITATASQTTITIPGAPGNTGDADRDAPLVDYMGIRANYVDVIGMRVVAGRAFGAVRHEGVREALIDRNLARQFFPTGNPLGVKIPFRRDQPLTIVGVVEHEFAVRLALGANHQRVLRLVLAEGARLVAVGLLIGAPGIYLAGHLIRGVLVGVSPLDPLTLVAVAFGLALVALAACYVPARRVLRLEPAQSLRQE